MFIITPSCTWVGYGVHMFQRALVRFDWTLTIFQPILYILNLQNLNSASFHECKMKMLRALVGRLSLSVGSENSPERRLQTLSLTLTFLI